MVELNSSSNSEPKKEEIGPISSIKINFTPTNSAGTNSAGTNSAGTNSAGTNSAGDIAVNLAGNSVGNSNEVNSVGNSAVSSESSENNLTIGAEKSTSTNKDNTLSTNDLFSNINKKPATSATNLMENISKQKDANAAANLKNILGNAALLEKNLEEERTLKLKKGLRLRQSILAFLVIALLSVQGYFFYELSPGLNVANLYTFNFEQNLTNKLTDLNKDLKSVQTLINKYKYLSAQLALNEFSSLSGKFLDGVASLNSNNEPADRTGLMTEIDEIKVKLPQLLATIKSNLTTPITVDTYATSAEEKLDAEQNEAAFQNDLRAALNDDKKNVLKAAPAAPSIEQIEAARFIDNTMKLVGNKKLISTLKNVSFESFQKDLDEYQNNNDPAQQKKVHDQIAALLESTKIDVATVSTIKNNRITWSSIIDRIKNITDTVNNDHNTGTANGSTFAYSGYEFNAEANKIVLSGINMTQSGTNTSVMSNLIDSFEASPFFMNVVNRSFPKAKTADSEGNEMYTMNFKIDLGLEKDNFSVNNAPIVLETSNTQGGVKRSL